MSANPKSLKKLILQSSIPLENECSLFLRKFGYEIYHERSYIRSNENNYDTDFSYDILATKTIENIKINLMIECKYREENIKWFFLPGDQKKVVKDYYINSFKNNKDFDYKTSVSTIGNLVVRGVEITSDKQNDSIINTGIKQLSYGLIHEIINSQNSDKKNIFIPILITTADLFVLNADTEIRKIQASKDEELIKENGKQELIVTYDIKNGKDIINYNEKNWIQYLKNKKEDDHILGIGIKYNPYINEKNYNKTREEEGKNDIITKHTFPGFVNIGKHSQQLYDHIENFIQDNFTS